MTSRARTTRRNQIPRDEIVLRGRESSGLHNHPWMYTANVKSGRQRTRKITVRAYNNTDMFGQLVARHGQRNEDLFVFNVVRVAKFQRRAKDY